MTGHRFAQMLRACLDRADMSQGALAGRLGVTQTAVSYWMNGHREPDLRTVCQLADIFEISVDRLLGREVEAVDHVERLRQIAGEQKRLADELITLYGPIEIMHNYKEE